MSADRNMVMVRIADPATEPVKEWLESNSRDNLFDPSILSYPVMKVLAGHSNGTTYNYLPMQGVAMLESIGVNPQASPLQVATGLMECVKSAVVLSQSAGYREMYFLCVDEITSKGAERMGFEELGQMKKQTNEAGEEEEVFVPFKMYRKRI